MKNRIKTYVVTGILLAFSFYLLPLNAQNLFGDDLYLSDSSPVIFFYDTDVPGYKWRLWGDNGNFGLYNYDTGRPMLVFDGDADMQLDMHATQFRITDELNYSIVKVHRDAPLSLDIQSDGDVSLAGYKLFIDGATDMGISLQPNNFYIQDQYNSNIVSVHRDAPYLSLDIQSDGDVSLAGGDVFFDTSLNYLGVGTTIPDAPIHLKHTGPKILFDDSDETGPEWLMSADQYEFNLYNNETLKYLLRFNDLATMQLSLDETKFRISDPGRSTIVSVHRDSPSLLDIQSNGDMSLGSSVFIDVSPGRLGIGTSTPIDDLEIQSSTPGIYFDDTSGSSTDWWMGNWNNDFVFRIEDNAPGLPLREIMTLDAETGNVGYGTSSPSAALHIHKTGSNLPRFLLDNGDSAQDYFVDVSDNGDLRMSISGSGKQEFMIDGPTGNVTMSDSLMVGGTISSGGQTLIVPDYVFEQDYDLMPMEELAAYVISQKHLPGIAPAAEIKENGINLSEFQMQLLQKVEELTLYTLRQDQQIRELKQQNQRIAELVMRMVTKPSEQVAMN